MPNIQDIIFTLRQRHSIFARYPFLPLALFLMLGIFLGDTLHLGIPTLLFVLLCLFFLLVAILSSHSILRHIAVYSMIFVFGLKTIDMAIPPRSLLPPGKRVYLGVVRTTPRLRQKVTQAEVRLVAMVDSNKLKPLKANVLVSMRSSVLTRELNYGDSILFITQAREVRNLGNPFEFDYQNYLRHKGIYYTGFVDTGHVKLIGTGGGSKPILWASRLRARLLRIYRFFGIKGTEYKILAALTLGYRQALDRQTLRKFSRSGAMHILAVSGLHVGILFGVLMIVFGRVMRSRYRWLALFVILFVLWSFALITGFSPSVRRSAFMFSVISLSYVIHHKPNIYNSLAASAFFLLMFFPADLFAVGFWLSYLAVVSIVAVYPLINNLIRLPVPLNRIWSLISVSVAAQIGTMPIGIYVFHQFPNYFLLTNLFAIPLAGIILYLALFLFAIARFTAIAALVARALKFFVKILLWAINITESLPGASSTNVFISLSQMILLYLLVAGFVLFFAMRKRGYFFVFITGGLLFFMINLVNKFSLTLPPRMIVYNIPGHSVVNFISPTTNVLLVDTGVNNQIIEQNVLPYWRFAHLPEAEVVQVSDSMKYLGKELIISRQAISFINKKALLLTDRKIMDKEPGRKLPVDFLLIANNVYTHMNEPGEFFNFKQIIFLSSCRAWRTKAWLRQADSLHLKAHDVNTQGAFIQKINYYD